LSYDFKSPGPAKSPNEHPILVPWSSNRRRSSQVRTRTNFISRQLTVDPMWGLIGGHGWATLGQRALPSTSPLDSRHSLLQRRAAGVLLPAPAPTYSLRSQVYRIGVCLSSRKSQINIPILSGLSSPILLLGSNKASLCKVFFGFFGRCMYPISAKKKKEKEDLLFVLTSLLSLHSRPLPWVRI
jgi:hypothetical protein